MSNMLHISTDRLAALGDEAPTTAEAAHLALCDQCARERAAYRTLVSMAQSERATIGVPITRWDSIAAAMRDEGFSIPFRSQSRRSITRWPLQVAAGLLILAGGAMLGRATAGAGPLPNGLTAAGRAPSQFGGATTHLVSDSAGFSSVADARAAQQRYELLYQQATAFLAQHDSGAVGEGDPVAYRSRLAALDRVISASREAMREAPHDPVINGYYLTTIGQREATLRQLNTALPASLRLNDF
jgi:hypothetical protein